MMRDWIVKLSQKFDGWRQSHLSDAAFLNILAVGIGLLAGAGAALLKGGVDWVTNFVFGNFDVKAGNLGFLALPIIGILLATLFTKYVIKLPMDHASDRIADEMSNGTGNLSPKLILGPIVACSITLGMGGSAGAEDPITYTGAAVGSNVGKAFKLPPDYLTKLMGCGASAAIGGIFMAPIGGVMFGLEVLKMKQDLQTILAVIFSSLTAALTCYILLGCHTDITFVPEMRFDNSLIGMVLLCGVVCGIYSAYYSHTMRFCRQKFLKVNNIWWRALIGGAILAVMLYVFPALYGEGYDTLRKLMVNDTLDIVSYSPLFKLGHEYWALLLIMAALLLVKPFATSATNDSGGIGGDFTPTFFCGGVLGFLFAAVCNHYIGMHLPVALFAFFGMAAVMSGAVRAPLMAIFIAAEMTGLYGFILPLTLVSAASVLTCMAVSNFNFKMVPLPFLHHKSNASKLTSKS